MSDNLNIVHDPVVGINIVLDEPGFDLLYGDSYCSVEITLEFP